MAGNLVTIVSFNWTMFTTSTTRTIVLGRNFNRFAQFPVLAPRHESYRIEPGRKG